MAIVVEFTPDPDTTDDRPLTYIYTTLTHNSGDDDYGPTDDWRMAVKLDRLVMEISLIFISDQELHERHRQSRRDIASSRTCWVK